MWFTPKSRARIAAIKADLPRSREMIDLMQKVVDNESLKDRTPEINAKLEEMKIDLAEHRKLLDETEAGIDKLEQPFLKFWKWMF